METVKVGFGEIINEMVEVGRANFPLLAVTMLAIVAGFSLLDMLSSNASNAINLVVTIFVQYQIVERMLADRVPSEPRKHRYGAMFIAGLLGGLATLVGFILLIVPGLFLLAAWSVTTPFIVIEDKSGTEALAASWRATAASRIPLMLVMLLGCALIGGGFAVLFLLPASPTRA
ncbi:hypothetical protein KRR38_04655 [Novosphingobium sp. G106]|uniref:hypothetical protein n=1 Tax=Novosphingobium sp. G106 TaxID=2849500 RepID=UPI001C2DC9B2|nr:hypothetical protein [Novosphingobium sp. G106]MBV1686982.1 hypothetical protein [Novosphingobium sp. G106]